MFASSRTRRFAALTFAGAVFLLLLVQFGSVRDNVSGYFSPPPSSDPPAPQEAESPVPPKPNYKLFGIEGLDSSIEITTLNLRARRSDKPPPLLQNLPADLPSFSKVRLDGGNSKSGGHGSLPTEDEILATIDKEGGPPVTVTVDIAPAIPTPDASQIVFGAATTVERLYDFLPNFKHWLPHTGAQLVVVCEPEPSDVPTKFTMRETVAEYKRHGINLTLVPSTIGYIDRYVSLITVLSDHLQPNTEWVSIIDDDTFFLSMTNLLAMLSKYPTSQPFYVGALSENKWNIDHGGISAVGGAGFFLTVPLLREIVPHADECMKIDNEFGDGRIADCILTYTTTKMSVEYGLFQLDLHGDVTGFYEAVRPQPVSVHHWRTWHHHEIPTVAAVSAVCGQPCVLQKYRFRDGWRLANGFSVVRYNQTAEEEAAQLPSAMEHTWMDTIWVIPTSWKYSLAPLRPKNEGKIQYLIEKADVDEAAGTVTSYYVRRVDEVGVGIVRVVWSKA